MPGAQYERFAMNSMTRSTSIRERSVEMVNGDWWTSSGDDCMRLKILTDASPRSLHFLQYGTIRTQTMELYLDSSSRGDRARHSQEEGRRPLPGTMVGCGDGRRGRPVAGFREQTDLRRLRQFPRRRAAP